MSFLYSIGSGRCLPNMQRGGKREFELIEEAESKSTFQVKLAKINKLQCIKFFQSKCWWFVVFVTLSNRIVWLILNPTTEIESAENSNITITVRQLPYGTSYPIQFDQHKSPFYELVFLHQIIGIYIFGWFLGNIDTISNGLILHVTAQFKIVDNAFKTVKQRTDELRKLVKISQSY